MNPVFLVVSGRLDDTNEMLQEILDFLHDVQHPLLSEIRDGINAMAGLPTSGGVSNGDLLFVLICALGFVGGLLLMQIFWNRIGR